MNGLCRRRPQPGDTWHPGEVFTSINVSNIPLAAVNQYGNVLDILVQAPRDKRAVTKFLRKVLKGLRMFRERRMRRFKDAGHAQHFLTAYGPIAGHRLTAEAYRQTRAKRFATRRLPVPRR